MIWVYTQTYLILQAIKINPATANTATRVPIMTPKGTPPSVPASKIIVADSKASIYPKADSD